MKKAWNIITSVIVIITVLLALALVGVRLFGLQVYSVLSGSMEPNYHVGSLIYVKDVSESELDVDDPITFVVEGNTVVTHRIIEIISDEDSGINRYRTQGDANDTPDGKLLTYENIIGTPVFTIPYLGSFANFIQQPPGLYIAVAAAALLIILIFVPDLFGKGKKH